ncbi:MAG: NAD-dependent epimerase/dehydratase family protein [Synergistaceae bacterium]|jgi:nucleoside-diphosphate-sugar epimerase|nr:NAD-dependent epimerase/dehydratase family protein [Synergistaceae bacterium]
MKRILVTGANGQIGVELTRILRDSYGRDNVIATDIKELPEDMDGPFRILDVRDANMVHEAMERTRADTIIHMAGILSAKGEEYPQLAWEINIQGIYNVLEVARIKEASVFFPSSIATFGPTTPARNTPQDTVQRPTSIYGISKVTGELLCDYYHIKYGVDVRGLRFPGLISHKALPGGGTTDYAVHIYYDAVKHGAYTCPISAGSYMDMMYMPDALDAVLQIMEADPRKFVHWNAFNTSAMSFDPEGIAAEIRRHIPDFEMRYEVNPVLQRIADSWPDSLDCTAAREEWGFNPRYDLTAMTDDMLKRLREKLTGE